MTTKIKSIVALLLIVGAMGAYLFVSYPLPIFARRIANADRVVASVRRSSVSIAITGEDAKRTVQAVASGSRQRQPRPWEMIRANDVKLTFYEGTNELGSIFSSDSAFCVFWVSDKKYRDDTGLLDKLAVHPAHEADVKWVERQRQPK